MTWHRSRRLTVLGSATLAATLLGLTGTAGADAAAPVAHGDATALTVTVLGTPISSGTFQAVDTGTGDASTHGSSRPAVDDLVGQSLVRAGMLGQYAATESHATTKGAANGASIACAGLAGTGATIADDGPTCLVPADDVTVDLGAVDLSQLRIVNGTLTTGLDPDVAASIRPIIAPLTSALRTTLTASLDDLGTPRVLADLTAAQSACSSSRAGATGLTRLSDASLRLSVPGQPDATLAALDDKPAANTDVSADLGDLSTLVSTATRPDLAATLHQELTDRGYTNVDEPAVMDSLMDNISTLLAPLREPLVTAVLNKQSRPSARSISLAAVDLQVTDALSDFGVEPTRVQIGKVSCGSRVSTPAVATSGTTKTSGTKAAGADSAGTAGSTAVGGVLPKAVAAGTAGGAPVLLGLGMLVLGLGAGAVGAQAVGRRNRA